MLAGNLIPIKQEKGAKADKCANWHVDVCSKKFEDDGDSRADEPCYEGRLWLGFGLPPENGENDEENGGENGANHIKEGDELPIEAGCAKRKGDEADDEDGKA